MKLNVVFFARYREALGLDGESVEGEFTSIDALRAHIRFDSANTCQTPPRCIRYPRN